MKKLLVLALILALTIGSVACTKETTAPASMDLGPTTAATTTATAETPASPLEGAVKALFTNMPEHIYKIDQAELVKKVNAGEKLMIVDIRQAADYEKGHLKGAVNLPWGTAISDNLSKLPQDQDVFVYCYTGQTAGQAVITMNLAGIQAKSINLGWNLGISKVAGVEAVTETTANELADAGSTIDPAVQEAVSAYFAGLATITDETYKNYKINEDALKALIDGGKNPFIVSVRKAEDYAKGHIAGAINIPFGKTTLDDLSALPKDQKIHVYCYTGQTAGETVAALRLLGYDAVSLNGGMGMASNHPNGWATKATRLLLTTLSSTPPTPISGKCPSTSTRSTRKNSSTKSLPVMTWLSLTSALPPITKKVTSKRRQPALGPRDQRQPGQNPAGQRRDDLLLHRPDRRPGRRDPQCRRHPGPQRQPRLELRHLQSRGRCRCHRDHRQHPGRCGQHHRC
jgi:rhodanese-related sulfurtransferase